MNNTWLEKHSLWLTGLALAALLILTLLTVTRRPPESPAHTTLSIVYVIATPTPRKITIQANAKPEQPTLPRALPAYAAPGGDLLGAVDSGRRYVVEARSGAAWTLIRIDGIGGFDGNGSIWVKSDELSGAANTPDLATMTPAAPPAQAVYVPVSSTPTIVPTVDPATISSTGTPCGLMPGGCYVHIP